MATFGCLHPSLSNNGPCMRAFLVIFVAGPPLVSVDDVPGNNRRAYLADELPAVVGRVARLGPRQRRVVCPLLLWVEDGHIAVCAGHEGTPAFEREDTCRPARQQFDDAPKRQLKVMVQHGDGDGQRGFESDDAHGRALELNLLLME